MVFPSAGNCIPDQHMLDLAKGTPEYPFAIAYYRIFWGGVYLFLLIVALFSSLVCYCGICDGLKENDYSGIVWTAAGVLLGIAIVHRKKPADKPDA